MAHIAGHLLTLTEVREIIVGLSPGVAGLYLLGVIFEKNLLVFLHVDFKRIYSFPKGDGAIAMNFGGEKLFIYR